MAKQQRLDPLWKATPKQALFIAEYLKDFNGAQAAIRAGFKANSAKVTASRLLSNANLKAEIERLRANVIQEAEVSAKDVIRELGRIALVDVRGFYDAQGRLKPMHELTPEQGAALAGVESLQRNVVAGDGIMDTVHKIKLWDKIRALETLARHFGLLVDKLEVSGSLTVIPARLEAARKRLAERNR